MGNHSYVSDIYQWIIDELVTKLRPEFNRRGLHETVLLELAEKWEKRIIEMKICEVPTSQIKLPYIWSNTVTQCDLRYQKFSHLYGGGNNVVIPSEWQLKQYQDAVALLLKQLIKIPPLQQRPNDRDYFFFLCQQYIAAVGRLQNQIRGLTSIKQVDKNSSHERDKNFLPMRSLTQNSHFLRTQTGFDDKPQLCNDKVTRHQNRKTGCPHSPITSQNLDCENLSECSISDDDTNASENLSHWSKNRIDCRYTQIKRRRIQQRTRFFNIVNNGIMFINGREYLFREAIFDIAWDNADKKSSRLINDNQN
jgi:hypothetical protein